MARALIHFKHYGAQPNPAAITTRACATETDHSRFNLPDRFILPNQTQTARVLILGGTGRIGGSTATALSTICPDLRIVIGGRNREKGDSMVASLGNNSEFLKVNIDEPNSLLAALDGVDLVVHAAGPFQRATECSVLETAIATKTAYVDVCDDTTYAQRARSLNSKAVEANVPAITTAGIGPGVSNVMAAELVRAAKTESNGKPERLRFSYYVAGSGGTGPTVLASSFLLLGEQVTAYYNGEKVKLAPYSGSMNIDFGNGIGKRDVYLLNLPEVTSAHEILGIPTVTARFGSAPFFWNWGMVAFTRLFPQEVLRDRKKVGKLVQQIYPSIRAMDRFSGESVSIRVDLECSDGRNTSSVFSHRKLSQSVGICTAAFVLAVLEGSTRPGVWFPEEPEGIAVEAREVLLKRAAQGTINFVMNK